MYVHDEANLTTSSMDSFQLECGKNYGVNFRIIAPTNMNTEMLREFDEPRAVPASKTEFNRPDEEKEPIE